MRSITVLFDRIQYQLWEGVDVSELPIYFLEGKPLLYDEDGCYQETDDGAKFRVSGVSATMIEDWREDGLSAKNIHGWLRVT